MMKESKSNTKEESKALMDEENAGDMKTYLEGKEETSIKSIHDLPGMLK